MKSNKTKKRFKKKTGLGTSKQGAVKGTESNEEGLLGGANRWLVATVGGGR